MRVIDSHTGGQPTRVIVGGGPDLGGGSVSEQFSRMKKDHDHVRKACVLEPKCDSAMVGALVCTPKNPACSAGVIFFNTAGYLGMCGHGLIGLLATLQYLKRIKPGHHLIETPVGEVSAMLLDANTAEFENVDSYVSVPDVSVNVLEYGIIHGHVAWGGNWFFLAKQAPLPLEKQNTEALTKLAWAIRKALVAEGITGEDGQEIDHIELFQPSITPGVNSKNFVLCPGGAYDRSPCGTGTSAKLACLAYDGQLAPGETWVQESFIGSQFVGAYQPSRTAGRITPKIRGSAYIYGDTTLIFQPGDPFSRGIE